MLFNNKFSTRNSKLYKMKCINTRNEEYKYLDFDYLDKIEKYNDKKWKIILLFFFFCYNKDEIERRKKRNEIFMCKCW